MKKILKFIVSSLFLASFFVVGCAQNPGGSGSGLLPSSEGNNPMEMLLSYKDEFQFKVPTMVVDKYYDGTDMFLSFSLRREEDGNLLEDHTLDIPDDFKVYFPDLNMSYKPSSIRSYFDYSYKETMANEGFLYLTLNKIEAKKGDYKTIITAKDSRNTSMLYVPALFNKVIVLKYKVEPTSYDVYLRTYFVLCDDSDVFDLEKLPIYSIKSDDSYSIDNPKSTIECDFDFNRFSICYNEPSGVYGDYSEKKFTSKFDYSSQEQTNIDVTYEDNTLIINANGEYCERVPSYSYEDEGEERKIDCNVTCKVKLVDISSGDNYNLELIWKVKDFYYEEVVSREEFFNKETGIIEEVTETSGYKVYVDSFINRTFTQTINMR